MEDIKNEEVSLPEEPLTPEDESTEVEVPEAPVEVPAEDESELTE